MKKRFEISRYVRKGDYSMHSAHSHSYYELFYLVDGQCRVLLGEHTLTVSSGSILIIPGNVLHQTSYYGAPTHERIYIEFSDEYIELLQRQYGKSWVDINLFNHLIQIPLDKRSDINALFNVIFLERQKQDEYSDSMLKCLFQSLIINLIRIQEQMSVYNSYTSEPIVDKAIHSAIDYISFNFQKKLTLEEVSGIVNLNPSYFSNKFKSVNGKGFKEYLNSVRVNYSEKLLLESNMDITDIALECGYESSNYFGDAFKKINGISPSKFRKSKGNIANI